MSEIVMGRLKRQIIRELAGAIAGLPDGHQVVLSMASDLITLSDFDKYVHGESNHELFKLWIKRAGKEFDPIQFANDAEIMLSMIQAKMEVAA